jgi:A/G-specific adenine glycosylase
MVDTNIRRVLSRVFSVEPAATETLADQVVPAHAAYTWNQALMDLGATVCRSKRPLCLVCPLVLECGGPRDAARTRPAEGAFHGSRRFYRGRVVDLLRHVVDAPLAEVAAVAGGRADLVRRLADEGLITIAPDERVRLAAE